MIEELPPVVSRKLAAKFGLVSTRTLKNKRASAVMPLPSNHP